MTPRRASRPCSAHLCPRLAVRGGRCEEHARGRRKEEDRYRGSRHERGYDRQHEKWREAVLWRDGGLCQPCARAGRTQVGNMADHIIPFDQGGARLDLENGQAICRGCHAFKTAWERSHGLGEPWPETEAGR